MLISVSVSTLQRLAEHYLPDGWQDWGHDDADQSHDTDFTGIQLAVAAYPNICHRVLAENWGLEYGALERPASSRKRKAETEADLRELKVQRLDQSHTEISIRPDRTRGTIIIRRTTTSESDSRAHPQMTLEEVLSEPRIPDSDELGWTNSSMMAARHQVRASLDLGPPSPGSRIRQQTFGKVVDEVQDLGSK